MEDGEAEFYVASGPRGQSVTVYWDLHDYDQVDTEEALGKDSLSAYEAAFEDAGYETLTEKVLENIQVRLSGQTVNDRLPGE